MPAAARRVVLTVDGLPVEPQLAARIELERRRRGVRRIGNPKLHEFAESLLRMLHPKQRLAFETKATELLFGGAAGPGKSLTLRFAALIWAIRIPGLQVYLFRREYPDLKKNHLDGPKGFLALLAPLVNEGLARINLSEHYIAIGPSRIHLCHCQHEKDVYGYQGSEIHLLLPDELTQFSDPIYRYLRGRVRMVGLEVPEPWRGLFPRIMAGSNPGGIGHSFVRESFVSPRPAFDVWRTPAGEGGMLRQFIPARLEDNPSMAEDDPTYSERLDGLGAPGLVRAMKEGDWDAVTGGAFDDLWNTTTARTLVLPPFEVPATWRIDRAFDWGDSKPFSIGWWAESDGTEAVTADGSKRAWPRGTLFRIAEWYGWTGRPNEGLRLVSTEIARRMVAMQKEFAFGARVQPGPADASIFDVVDGKCIAEDMERMGCRWTRSDKSSGSRENGLQLIRSRLAAAFDMETTADGRRLLHPKWPMESPGLFVFNTCRQAIRTVPVLPLAPSGKDVDTHAEDHPYDEMRYRCLAEKREMSVRSLRGV